MAGNFWQSSHCAQWVLDKIDLSRERAADLAVLSEEEYTKVSSHWPLICQLRCQMVMLLVHFLGDDLLLQLHSGAR